MRYLDEDVILQLSFVANPSDLSSTQEYITFYDIKETDESLFLATINQGDGGFVFMIVGIIGVLIVLVSLLITGVIVYRKKSAEL
jgi:hypothetical protein